MNAWVDNNKEVQRERQQRDLSNSRSGSSYIINHSATPNVCDLAVASGRITTEVSSNYEASMTFPADVR